MNDMQQGYLLLLELHLNMNSSLRLTLLVAKKTYPVRCQRFLAIVQKK